MKQLVIPFWVFVFLHPLILFSQIQNRDSLVKKERALADSLHTVNTMFRTPDDTSIECGHYHYHEHEPTGSSDPVVLELPLPECAYTRVVFFFNFHIIKDKLDILSIADGDTTFLATTGWRAGQSALAVTPPEWSDTVLIMQHNNLDDFTIWSLAVECYSQCCAPLPDSVSFCEGDAVSLDGRSSGFSQYRWLDDEGTNLGDAPRLFFRPITLLNQGWYFLEALGASCELRDSVYVHVHARPSIELIQDTIITCPESVATFVSMQPDSLLVSWRIDGTFITFGNSCSAWLNRRDSVLHIRASVSRNGCEASVNGTALPYAHLSPEDIVTCKGDTVVLSLPGSLEYEWHDFDGNFTSYDSTVVMQSFSSTSYLLYSIDEHDCSWVDTVNVFVPEQPSMDTQISVCDATPVLIPGPEGMSRYSWTVGDETEHSASLYRLFDQDTLVTLSVQDTFGCPHEYDIMIRHDACCDQTFDLGVVNAFSPNGDGVNDTFTLEMGSRNLHRFTGCNISVFDRWGGLCYETVVGMDAWRGGIIPLTYQWTGSNVSLGVYVYVISIGCIDDNGDEIEVLYAQDVTVIK